MPYHSKWEYLPTEAINPETFRIDKMPTLDVVDLFVADAPGREGSLGCGT